MVQLFCFPLLILREASEQAENIYKFLKLEKKKKYNARAETDMMLQLFTNWKINSQYMSSTENVESD